MSTRNAPESLLSEAGFQSILRGRVGTSRQIAPAFRDATSVPSPPPPHRLDPGEVSAWFASRGVVDPPDYPRGRQLELLTALAQVYTDFGVIDGLREPPLWCCCPRAGTCWKSAAGAKPAAEGGRSGLALPWVGPQYREGGVVTVGINLRNAGGLLREWEITCGSGGLESQIARLEAGHRTMHGSPFGYRSARSAAAAVAWFDGREVRDVAEPRLLVTPLERTARLQFVKCSPDDGDRSSPTREMSANCPPLLLQRELDTLQPGVVLAFGTEVLTALEQLPGCNVEDGDDWSAWGTVRVGRRQAAFVWLYHPSGRYWKESQGALIAELRRREPRTLERRVLGGLMLSPPNTWEQAREQGLMEGDFTVHEHRLIFQAMSGVVARQWPIDCLTVTEQLREQGRLDTVGGAPAVDKMVHELPAAITLWRWIQALLARSRH